MKDEGHLIGLGVEGFDDFTGTCLSGTDGGGRFAGGWREPLNLAGAFGRDPFDLTNQTASFPGYMNRLFSLADPAFGDEESKGLCVVQVKGDLRFTIGWIEWGTQEPGACDSEEGDDAFWGVWEDGGDGITWLRVQGLLEQEGQVKNGLVKLRVGHGSWGLCGGVLWRKDK